MAVIVTRGKVDGKPAGSRIDGLTREQEKRLVDLGVAEYDSPAENGMSAKELRERCKELGLPSGGSKAEMAERIAEYEASEAAEEPEISEDENHEGAGEDAGGDDGDAPVLTAQVPE